jgi:hypothetical protein
VDGFWGRCEGETLPVAELCNAVDDDCDGILDNGFERDGALCFYVGAKGACRTRGHWRCSGDGTTSSCDAPRVQPTAETCDGIDNDCDGEVDNASVPRAEQECSTGKSGVCGPGTNTCVNATIRCIQRVQPGPEICNRLDDDCDGDVDEDCISPEEAARIRTGG